VKPVRKTTQLTLGSSKPNISRIPMNPSVAWRTALLRAAMDLLDLDPAVPTVEACWLAICNMQAIYIVNVLSKGAPVPSAAISMEEITVVYVYLIKK
jgi:hypothetical protein